MSYQEWFIKIQHHFENVRMQVLLPVHFVHQLTYHFDQKLPDVLSTVTTH